MGRMGIAIKRIYEEPTASDGYRVLVDRLWPRGMTKERAALDLWLKDVAPSPLLRKWFGHDPAKFRFWESITVRLTRIRIHSRSLTGRNPALAYFF